MYGIFQVSVTSTIKCKSFFLCCSFIASFQLYGTTCKKKKKLQKTRAMVMVVVAVIFFFNLGFQFFLLLLLEKSSVLPVCLAPVDIMQEWFVVCLKASYEVNICECIVFLLLIIRLLIFHYFFLQTTTTLLSI